MKIKFFLLPFLFIILVFLITNSSDAQVFEWSSPGGGTNGIVYASVVYNNQLVVAGRFSSAGSVSVNNIALWNGANWQAIGSPVNGVNDTVYALMVMNGDLIAGGKFTSAGGVSASGVARWNGSGWNALGSGVSGQVKALGIFNGLLIAGGTFTAPGSNIAGWNGSSWVTLGSGMNDDVYTLLTNSGILYAGGKFTTAGGVSANRIASWNGSSWSPLGSGMNESVFALSMYGSYLIAGGKFTQAGGNSASYLALWNGSAWSPLPTTLDDAVYSLNYFNGLLVMGGRFRNAGSLFVNRICYWDGNSWFRMVTGMNGTVYSLTIKDTAMFAGGSFTSAGGDTARFVAVWSNQQTHTISGQVRYADNNQPVGIGVVKAVRLDISTREVIQIDSATVQNGNYVLPRIPLDSIFIISFPSDEISDNFVPTYHPSTIDWLSAVKVYASTNLSNVNINVLRAVSNNTSPAVEHIAGYVYLNYTPPLFQGSFPYNASSIVYAAQSGVYKKFSVSDFTEHYMLDSLTPGSYDVYVNRLGYTSVQTTVNLGTTSLDTVNFYLDTLNFVIGIKNLETGTPKSFVLEQNYPNPFNPSTKIRFALDKSTFVDLAVFDVLGRQVDRILSGTMKAGYYELTYNAINRPSGVYFYRLTTDGSSETRKMILIK